MFDEDDSAIKQAESSVGFLRRQRERLSHSAWTKEYLRGIAAQTWQVGSMGFSEHTLALEFGTSDQITMTLLENKT